MDPCKGEPLEDDRDLGAGQAQKRVSERTSDMETTGARRRTPGDGWNLGSRSSKSRELGSRMSNRIHLVGAMSRWTDAPQPGEFGVKSGCN